MGLRDKLREILVIKDTPHRIAIAFAAGVFLGMSPLLGLHTILGFTVAWIFKLNKLVTITGVYVTNPWTIVPIYTFSTWFGAKCLGLKQIIPDIDWHNATMSYFLEEMQHLLWPFIIGTTIIGIFSAVISYYIIHSAVKRAHSIAK